MILSLWIEGFPLWFRMSLTGLLFLAVVLQSLSIRKLLSKKIKFQWKNASGELQEDRRKK